MKKIVGLFLITMLFVGSAFAAVDAYIIPLTSGIYDDMDALYIMNGQVIPSAARPWSVGEAERIFSRIDTSRFRENEKALYDHLREELDGQVPQWGFDDEFRFDIGIDASPEMYLHSNGDDFKIDTDWSYNYDERPIFLKLHMDLSVSSYMWTYCDLSFGVSRYQKDGLEYFKDSDYPWGVGAIIPEPAGAKGTDRSFLPKASNLWYDTFTINIPDSFSDYDIDFTTPKRAVFSLGGGSWNLMLGREKLNWGHSHIGNFTIDDHVSFHETARLTFNTEKFKYDWTNLFLDTLPFMDENSDVFDSVPEGTPDSVPEYFRVMMNHRLEFRPWPIFRFAISESIMWKGKAFEGQAVNPSFIYHQINNRAMYNCLASLEAYVTPVKGLNIYFEFGLDNATLVNEGTSQADANGWLLGADYTHALGKGYMRASLEYARTTPIMYRRDGVDFLMLQRCYTLGAPDKAGNMGALTGTSKLYYIGFPYGSDAQVLHLGLMYKMPGVFEAGIEWNGVRKGDVDMFQTHNVDGDGNPGTNNGKANIKGKTPTGTGSKNFELFLYGRYIVPEFWEPLDISFFSTLSWVRKDGKILGDEEFDDAQDVQFSFGVTLNI